MAIFNIEDEEERFEKYIDYWHENGFGKLLDTHLRLQAPMFAWFDGSVRVLDWMIKIETMEQDWKDLSKHFGVKFKELEKARKNYHRALNDTKVSDMSKRKICQIIALDYCCLNYKL